MLKIDGYPYLYETHLHTNAGSACGNNSPEEMVRAAYEYGYTGIFITEHNWGGNSAIDRSLPWDEYVDKFCEGYERAKAEGEKIGLQVFFAWEAGFNGTEFLIYGLSKEWMKAHPEIWDADVSEQYRLVKEGGGMVIHAHPFREEWYIPEIRLYPDLVDGVEGVNATHSSHLSEAHNVAEYNDRAIEYAKKNNLPMTAGSDIHSTTLFGGGVAFKRRLTDDRDFINAILNREDYMLTDGERVYESK